MPASKTPILPGTRILLRAVHAEMREKNYIQQQPTATDLDPSHAGSATSSGVHSNSSASDACDVTEIVNIKRPARNRRKKMAVGGRDNEEGLRADSSTEVESDDSDKRCASGHWDPTSSDDDDVGHFERHQFWAGRRPDEGRPTRLKNFPSPERRRIELAKQTRLATGALWDDCSHKPFSYNEREIVLLTEREQQQLRDGYFKFAMRENSKAPGTSFGAQLSAFSKVEKPETKEKQPLQANGHDSDTSVLQFPLEMAAAGIEQPMGLRKAKHVEKQAKKKTKNEKHLVVEAKLGVAEAKLGEFDAKLRARQARIDERHAKLCRRRAALKEAKERLQNLERHLDGEEETQRERERRVRNRERRVKQEEAGLQIKEASLRTREGNVTDSIKDLERRRKLVEEKEGVLGAMEDLMRKQEAPYERSQSDDSKSKSGAVGRAVGSLGRKFLRSKQLGNANVNHRTDVSPARNDVARSVDCSPNRSGNNKNHTAASSSRSRGRNQADATSNRSATCNAHEQGSSNRSGGNSNHVDPSTNRGSGRSTHSNTLPSRSAKRRTELYEATDDDFNLVRTRADRMSTGSLAKQSTPVPTPRKSLEKRGAQGRERSNSLDNEIDDGVKDKRQTQPSMTNSLSRFKGHKTVMGLWL